MDSECIRLDHSLAFVPLRAKVELWILDVREDGGITIVHLYLYLR